MISIRKLWFIAAFVILVLIIPILYLILSTSANSGTILEAFHRSAGHGINILKVEKISWAVIKDPFELQEELTESRSFIEHKEAFLLVISGKVSVAGGYSPPDAPQKRVVTVMLYGEGYDSVSVTRSIDYQVLEKYGKIRSLNNPWATILWWEYKALVNRFQGGIIW